MNILVLGGTGFLGQHCAHALSIHHKVYIAGLFQSPCIGANCFSVTLSETNRIIKIIEDKQIDVVLHLVSTLIPSSDKNAYKDDIKNVYLPTIALLDYCAERKIKFIYFSSAGAIYGNRSETFSETSECKPVSYYGLSKLHIENAILFYHRSYGLDYLIIRPSNPYGKGQNIYGKQGIIAVIIGKILSNSTIEIWGDGSAVKDFIYIDDFTAYFVFLFENQHLWNNTYNIGSGVSSSVNDVISAFRENNITLPQINYIQASNSDAAHIVLDCRKINSVIKHDCLPLKDGIARFWKNQVGNIVCK